MSSQMAGAKALLNQKKSKNQGLAGGKTGLRRPMKGLKTKFFLVWIERNEVIDH
jgi:hypothetical protein